MNDSYNPEIVFLYLLRYWPNKEFPNTLNSPDRKIFYSSIDESREEHHNLLDQLDEKKLDHIIQGFKMKGILDPFTNPRSCIINRDHKDLTNLNGSFQEHELSELEQISKKIQQDYIKKKATS